MWWPVGFISAIRFVVGMHGISYRKPYYPSFSSANLVLPYSLVANALYFFLMMVNGCSSVRSVSVTTGTSITAASQLLFFSVSGWEKPSEGWTVDDSAISCNWWQAVDQMKGLFLRTQTRFLPLSTLVNSFSGPLAGMALPASVEVFAIWPMSWDE